MRKQPLFLAFGAAVALFTAATTLSAQSDRESPEVPTGPPVTPNIYTVAGDGTRGYFGVGNAATEAELNSPFGVAVDKEGNYYISDTSNQRIRMVSTSGVITTIAGVGTPGYSGDNGPALAAKLATPKGIAVTAPGVVYFADFANHAVRKVVVGAPPFLPLIDTVAGNGTPGFSGDGGPATKAQLKYPNDVKVDSMGNLYISDSYNSRVRMVNAAGIITTIAGNGQQGYTGDNGPATLATLKGPAGLALDSAGNLYIADSYNDVVRKVTPKGIISTVAGTGKPGDSGDNGPATSAQLNLPAGLAVDSADNLYIADTGNNRIRKVTPSGIISTYAGTGASGYAGDGGPAVDAKLNSPASLGVDALGDLFIADTSNNVIREVGASGTLPTLAPVFSPAAGTYETALNVTVSSLTSGAKIYYTTDGSTPTANSPMYGGPLTITKTTAINSIAIAPGYGSSAVSSAAYTIVKPTGAPVITPAQGVYARAQFVKIADATPGAVIYYTTDGSKPTAASQTYSVPFLVGTNTTVQAIAVTPGGGASSVAFESYVFVGSPSALGAPATNITATKATFNAFVNTLGLAGSYFFKFGTTMALTLTSPATALAASTKTVPVSDNYIQFQPKTTYYFQIVVTTAGGTGLGPIQSFTTN